jgi:hypothetical protein
MSRSAMIPPESGAFYPGFPIVPKVSPEYRSVPKNLANPHCKVFELHRSLTIQHFQAIGQF